MPRSRGWRLCRTRWMRQPAGQGGRRPVTAGDRKSSASTSWAGRHDGSPAGSALPWRPRGGAVGADLRCHGASGAAALRRGPAAALGAGTPAMSGRRRAPMAGAEEAGGRSGGAGKAGAVTADAEARGAGAAGAGPGRCLLAGVDRRPCRGAGGRSHGRAAGAGGVCKPRASARPPASRRCDQSWPCPCLVSSIGGAGSARAVAIRREAA